MISFCFQKQEFKFGPHADLNVNYAISPQIYYLFPSRRNLFIKLMKYLSEGGMEGMV